MHLSRDEVETLQEQLVLIYKVIHQNRMAKTFYFQGIETDNPRGKLINRINQLENPEETLELCIIELEEMKENKHIKKDSFNEIMENYDISFLNKKYYIKKPEDLDNLEVKELLSVL